jgi:phosphoserine phosphatase RsbU/P
LERRSLEVPERGSYWLVGLEGRARKTRLPIDTPVLVGRGTYNHVVLDDPHLSRQHARLAPERDGCVIYDLNSVNGTFVNGVAVKRQRLAPNDLVSIGPFVFRIELVVTTEPRPGDVEEATLPGVDVGAGPESISLMSTAIESRDSSTQLPAGNLTQLEEAYENLGTLYAFTQAISKTIDRGELLHLIGARVLEVFPSAQYVAVYLRWRREGAADELRLAHVVGPLAPGAPPLLPANVLAAVDRRTALLTSQAAPVSRGGTNMYAPLLEQGGASGVLHVSAHEHGRTYSLADLELLKGMAAPATIMLQNTRMYEESLVEDRFRHDLALAAEIQKSFLPREVVAVEGLELFAEYRAAYTVSGDFYDVFWVARDRLAVFIGDISGKGISGALLMARISSELRVAALAHVDPVAVLTAMNSATLGRGQTEMFFTAIYFTIDVKTGDVVLANAGHPSPYVCRADGAVHSVTGGAACAVGILDDPEYASTTFNLAPGDTLVLYTDGVVEASDARGNLYGDQRLLGSLHGSAALRPRVIAENILRHVDHHAAGGPVNDDLTLFLCRRSESTRATMQPRRRSSVFPAPDLTKLPPSNG